ncbi:MAG TPA: 3-methyl-2-oxobutanoate hydroxymethyltransferase, partial [Bacteroidetes bacterium]|nr:3-methyl-2-oxobutanoate hydroxymethyltransferase [Bacteroidota bacterium]
TLFRSWSAKIIDASNVDCVLVGDSTSMVMHGYENTTNATIEMLKFHVKAVRKGTKKLLIADLPFMHHLKGDSIFYSGVDELIKAGAQAIKIEGTNNTLNYVENLTQSGIPVIGHLGLTPQSINKFGGYKVQGKSEEVSKIILEQAENLEKAGCSAIVLELIPSELAKEITENITIPTIGIGAGKYTSGQVLVLQDLLGMSNEFNPKFLKKFMKGYDIILDALNTYSSDVKNNFFPSDKESF